MPAKRAAYPRAQHGQVNVGSGASILQPELQLEIFNISVQQVPWFEAAGLVKPSGSFVLPKMSNRSEFHPSSSHLLLAVQNYRPSKTTTSVIHVRAHRFKQSGVVQLIVPDNGEGSEGSIRSLDN